MEQRKEGQLTQTALRPGSLEARCQDRDSGESPAHLPLRGRDENKGLGRRGHVGCSIQPSLLQLRPSDP